MSVTPSATANVGYECYHAIGVTRLESFLKANSIRPSHLADYSGISRQHLFRLRFGRAEPTRKVILGIAIGCGIVLRRRVRPEELFDLGDA